MIAIFVRLSRILWDDIKGRIVFKSLNKMCSLAVNSHIMRKDQIVSMMYSHVLLVIL